MEIMKIKEIATNNSQNADQACNDFLAEIGTRVISVTPIYSNEDGIIYVIQYWSTKYNTRPSDRFKKEAGGG